MPDFVPTHYIMLFGTTVADGTLSWGVKNPPNLASGAKVADVGKRRCADARQRHVQPELEQILRILRSRSVARTTGDLPQFRGHLFRFPYDSAVSDPSPLQRAERRPNVTFHDLLRKRRQLLPDRHADRHPGRRTGRSRRSSRMTLVLTAEGTATPVLWVWQQEITNIFGPGRGAPRRSGVAAHCARPRLPVTRPDRHRRSRAGGRWPADQTPARW